MYYCAICLVHYDDENARALECAHVFCKSCLGQGIRSGLTTCPVCQFPINREFRTALAPSSNRPESRRVRGRGTATATATATTAARHPPPAATATTARPQPPTFRRNATSRSHRRCSRVSIEAQDLVVNGNALSRCSLSIDCCNITLNGMHVIATSDRGFHIRIRRNGQVDIE